MPKTARFIGAREAWLLEGVERLRPHFRAVGHELADHIKVSVGWPSRGGLSTKKPVIGQCFYEEASSAGNFEIFISPTIGDGVRALDVLVHELAHTCLPITAKHGKSFAALARKLGLAGKPTATVAGEELTAELKRISKILGDYPHAQLVPMTPKKKQTTRQLKATCKQCGYVVRVAQKWLTAGGPPICPICTDNEGCTLMVREEDADGSPDQD